MITHTHKFYNNKSIYQKEHSIGNGNWIVDNLNSALATWNGKLAEIWTLLSTSPENFKGGGIWHIIVGINDGLKAVGYALLVLFFVMGIMKTCGSFAELKKPELAVKCLVRFVLAEAAVTYGMDIMTALFTVAQGAVSTIMTNSGLSAVSATSLPADMVTVINSVSFMESIPLWAITLLGSLFIPKLMIKVSIVASLLWVVCGILPSAGVHCKSCPSILRR